MTWRAFIKTDPEGNQCVYMQDGSDKGSRELHDMVEHDIKHLPDMVKQLQDYLNEAEAICEERNEE